MEETNDHFVAGIAVGAASILGMIYAVKVYKRKRTEQKARKESERKLDETLTAMKNRAKTWKRKMDVVNIEVEPPSTTMVPATRWVQFGDGRYIEL